MTDQHPITPPPELVEQWWQNAIGKPEVECVSCVAHQAARWGADQELKACCEWLERNYNYPATNYRADHPLRTARRPKPPSLKEQALEALKEFKTDVVMRYLINTDERLKTLDTIRRALEALPND